MYKKLKFSKSIISTSILFLLFSILVIIFFNQITIKNTLNNFTRYDSLLINKLGQIRGGIQRYVKLKIIYNPKAFKVKKSIDNYFNDIEYYLKQYPQIIPNDYLIEFYGHYNSLISLWKQIKLAKKEKELINFSEEAWKMADNLTTLMEKISEKKLIKLNQKIMFFTILSFSIIVVLIFIVYLMVRSGLEKATITEPMTKLYNRFYFEHQINYLYEKFKRTKKPFSAMLLDIDNFKQINDTFGHHIGDEVLKKVAHILQEESRKTDMVFRYGGEEFIILFPDSKIEEIKKVAERIRKKIEQNIQVEKRIITISGGIGEFNENMPSIQHFLRELDNALYTAKRTGKNKIIPI